MDVGSKLNANDSSVHSELISRIRLHLLNAALFVSLLEVQLGCAGANRV